MRADDENEEFDWERAAFVAVARQAVAIARIYGNGPLRAFADERLRLAYEQATVAEVAAGHTVPMAYE